MGAGHKSRKGDWAPARQLHVRLSDSHLQGLVLGAGSPGARAAGRAGLPGFAAPDLVPTRRREPAVLQREPDLR
jgi:hypothetical protein